MFRWTCTTPIHLGFYERAFEPGDWTLLENNQVKREDGRPVRLAETMERYGYFEAFSLSTFAPTLDWEQVKEGDRVLMHRTGALGDALHTAPLVYELQARGAHVTLCCEQAYSAAFPLVGPDETRCLADYGRLPVEADWTVNLESCVEGCHKPMPIVDQYLRRTINPPAALKDFAGRMPGGRYFEEAKVRAHKFVLRGIVEPDWNSGPGGFDVLLAPYASGKIRSVPLLDRLPREFVESYSCGLIGMEYPAITSPYPMLTKLPTAELYRTLLNSKLVVTADNGIAHLAYWLGIPLVAFFAAVDWRARLYPAGHVCIVDCISMCPMGSFGRCSWHDGTACPVLANVNERVAACPALACLQPAGVAALLEDRLGAEGFAEVDGRQLSGVPEYILRRSGLRNPDGSPFEPTP